MNNYDEKIKKIKETEKELLTSVKEEIEKNNNVLNLEIGNVINLFNYDSTLVKKYEAVVNAQKLIFGFARDINNSTSVDEIKEIRNKLNYYINKIKKEIKDRNLSEEVYNKYYENSTNLRKSIAKYVRYLKREDKISEIEYLNNNIDKLNEEELLRLKNLIKNEVNYGKKNNVKEEPFNIFGFKPAKKVDFDEDLRNSKVLKEIRARKPVVPSGDNKVASLDFTVDAKPSTLESYSSVMDFLNKKVEDYESRYKLVKTDKYTKNVIKNIPILVKNVPKLIQNKKKIKGMKTDFNPYFGGITLEAFSKFQKKKNSILNNIKQTLFNGILKRKEEEILDEHDECVRAIKKYCRDRHVYIRYSKTI